MFPKIAMFLVCMCCCLCVHAFAESTSIGTIKNVQGEVVVERQGKTMSARQGLPIFQDDIITTGHNGLVGIVFQDNSRMSLDRDSRMTVTEFVYQPSDQNFSFISRIFQGAATYVSGFIGKIMPEAVRFHTPVATMGLRGTSVAIKVKPEE